MWKPFGPLCPLSSVAFVIWFAIRLAQGDDPWVVRILPKVHWGAHPAGLDNLFPDDPRIGVMHHFLGSWKVKGGWRKRRISVGALARRVSAWLYRRCGVSEPLHVVAWDVPYRAAAGM